jgi:hypothetical protein
MATSAGPRPKRECRRVADAGAAGARKTSGRCDVDGWGPDGSVGGLGTARRAADPVDVVVAIGRGRNADANPRHLPSMLLYLGVKNAAKTATTMRRSGGNRVGGDGLVMSVMGY